MREETVERVEALMDMFVVVCFTRGVKGGRWRDGVFYTQREWTWHVSSPVQGPMSLLRPNIPSIGSGRNGRMGFCGGV